MRHLHDIRPGAITAWIWANVVGMNGRQIGNPPGANRYQVTDHIYQITRSMPPPLPPDTEMTQYRINTLRDRRRYWLPWSHATSALSNEQRLNPLCGPIRSTSQGPRIYARSEGQTWHVSCENCMNIAREQNIETQYVQTLSVNDPWYQARHAQNETPIDWLTFRDPVTGL